MVKAIEKAILTSDIGINPSNDGRIIRLVFPELTEERRKDLVKEVKKKGEAGKVAIRNIRRDANDYLKKLGKTEVSEDEISDLEDAIQKMTDKYIKDIDKATEESQRNPYGIIVSRDSIQGYYRWSAAVIPLFYGRKRMNIPNHVAIILDGNGRWAKSKGMPRNYGHVKGAQNLEVICGMPIIWESNT